MNIDAGALGRAVRALVQTLQAEADKQHAYLFHFPDGRISLEMEWLDVESIARTVIATYVEHVGTTDRLLAAQRPIRSTSSPRAIDDSHN